MSQKEFNEVFLNFYEQGMRAHFTLLYNHYNRSRLEFLKNLEKQNIYVSRFYTFLCSFAQNQKVIDAFQHVKDLVVPELFYNHTFWHVKEGYIEEQNENLPRCLNEIDELACNFVVAMIEYQREKNLSDFIFDNILTYALKDLTSINKKYGETDATLTAGQFAELLLIRSLIPKLDAVREKNYIIVT